MHNRTLEYLSPSLINPRLRAWRTHSERQNEGLIASLRGFDGVVEPPLIDRDNTIVCGSRIVELALQLGIDPIPVVRVHDMTPERLRLYAVAAGRLAAMGGFDNELLAEEIRDLQQIFPTLDLAVLAFEDGELDALLGHPTIPGAEDEHVPIGDNGLPPISEPGVIWNFANLHRMMCADLLGPDNLSKLMAGQLAQFALADPPYNLDRRVYSSNEAQQNFQYAHGEMSPGEFTRFLTKSMRIIAEACEEGSLHAFFMSYHFLLELLRAGTIVYGRPKAIVTWVKESAGQGGLFRSQTEFITYFHKGPKTYRNNVQLGKHGRNRSTAWHYAGMNTPSAERDELLKLHATPKPSDLLKDAILDVTSRGGIVLDPFAGIGSVMVAAHAVERRCFSIEIEPGYVDAAVRRMRALYGIDAVRESDGVTFSELEARQWGQAND